MASSPEVIYEILDWNLKLKRAITGRGFDDGRKWHMGEAGSPARQAG